MPDVYAQITEIDPQTQERLIDVLEMRASDLQQRRMWEAYLSQIEFPPAAQVLEIGCGTGTVSRILAQWPGVARVLGVDPSSAFITKARSLAQGLDNLSFEQSDGRSLTLNDESFDVVISHQVLSHVPQPEQLLAEVFRVLRPTGWLAVFDGDYATATVATTVGDPLEACVHAFRTNFVHDPWIVRRLPQLLQAAGFDVQPMRSHGYIEAPEAGYMLTWIDRGADVLLQAGHIGPETAAALKAEARQRSTARAWFGHIAFASILGCKPAATNTELPRL
ncbi:MAG: methyltransferase domain-containing protein [Chloroflexi bacterium]|nr:MAG: methyltransferase domain-containing protein [Chloroflexota bacterium]